MSRLIFQPDQTKKAISTSPITFPHWISGSFVLLRKEHFDLLGGWDDQFWMYCEDIDLSKRGEEKGLLRVLLNQWECLHSHGVSSRADKKTKVLTKAEVINSNHIYFEKLFIGKKTKLLAKTSIFEVPRSRRIDPYQNFQIWTYSDPFRPPFFDHFSIIFDRPRSVNNARSDFFEDF